MAVLSTREVGKVSVILPEVAASAVDVVKVTVAVAAVETAVVIVSADEAEATVTPPTKGVSA